MHLTSISAAYFKKISFKSLKHKSIKQFVHKKMSFIQITNSETSLCQQNAQRLGKKGL